MAGFTFSLRCQIDTFGDYQLLLLPDTANSVRFVENLGPSPTRLLDGRPLTTRRGFLDIDWYDSTRTVPARVLRLFDVRGHPAEIKGFVGGFFFRQEVVQIDYKSNQVVISR
mgnify:FL=1